MATTAVDFEVGYHDSSVVGPVGQGGKSPDKPASVRNL